MEEIFTFPSANGRSSIHAGLWAPDRPRGCLQITHGMAEHIGRYLDFIRYLNARGWAVAGMDLAGHGQSDPPERYGDLGPGGWESLLADMDTLRRRAARAFPGLPHVMLGHSMGAFLICTYLTRHGQGLAGAILSGTAGANPAVGPGLILARMEARARGASTPSPRLDNLSFGSYGRRFTPRRTKFDWLTRDEAVVDRYVADPACGFIFTAGGFVEMLTALKDIGRPAWARAVPPIPLLLISGEQDPVGNFGRGPRQRAKWLRDAGHRDVTVRIYPGGRHEMLNELNREEVYADVAQWLENVLAARAGVQETET